jgi:hypothetical protein
MANSLTIIDSTTNEVLLRVDQGSDFGQTLRFYTDDTNTTAKDITDHSFAARARHLTHKNDNDVVDFTAEATDAANGVVNFALTDTQTSAMKAGKWVWDLEMTDSGGTVTRLMWGEMYISPEATYS